MTHGTLWKSLPALAEHRGEPLGALLVRLTQAGWCDATGRPSAKAKQGEFARWVMRKGVAGHCLWHSERMSDVLPAAFQQPNRPRPVWKLDSRFETLTEIGARTGLAPAALGARLKRLGWRLANGLPTVEALHHRWAHTALTLQGYPLTRWDWRLVLAALARDGLSARTPQAQAAHLVVHDIRRANAQRMPQRPERVILASLAKRAQPGAAETVAAHAARIAPEHSENLATALKVPTERLDAVNLQRELQDTLDESCETTPRARV